ncbi:MAG: DUF998 domain-containing protein [Candidatus Thorarchaeota archaeon]|nr:MAG: DUF998 domain-containing protein [Candidatus Thorarchaeota archaeon]
MSLIEITEKWAHPILKADRSTLSGYLFFIGGLQWFIGLLAAESWYAGYSSRIDYVSELGIGPTAVLYNASVFILGALIVVGSYFLNETGERKGFSLLLALAGVGAAGVGVFPGYQQPMHSIFTLIAILFGSFAAIASYRHQRKPMSHISMVLGIVALVCSFMFMPYLGLPTGSTETFLGLAKGSMERWAIYPILAWIMSYGSYLVGSTDATQ